MPDPYPSRGFRRSAFGDDEQRFRSPVRDPSTTRVEGGPDDRNCCWSARARVPARHCARRGARRRPGCTRSARPGRRSGVAELRRPLAAGAGDRPVPGHRPGVVAVPATHEPGTVVAGRTFFRTGDLVRESADIAPQRAPGPVVIALEARPPRSLVRVEEGEVPLAEVLDVRPL